MRFLNHPFRAPIASFFSGEIKVGIRNRDSGDGKELRFENIGEHNCKFTGGEQLREIAARYDRPLRLYQWVENRESCEGNGHYSDTDIVIYPDSVDQHLAWVKKTIDEGLAPFVDCPSAA